MIFMSPYKQVGGLLEQLLNVWVIKDQNASFTLRYLTMKMVLVHSELREQVAAKVRVFVECLQISAKYFDCCEVRSASLSLLPPFSLLQLVSPPPPSWQQPLDGFNLQPHKGLEPEEFNIFQQSRSRDLSAWRGTFTTIRPTSGQFIAGGHGGIFVVISL